MPKGLAELFDSVAIESAAGTDEIVQPDQSGVVASRFDPLRYLTADKATNAGDQNLQPLHLLAFGKQGAGDTAKNDHDQECTDP